MTTCAIIGRGRAGTSFAAALEKCGWSTHTASGTDLVADGVDSTLRSVLATVDLVLVSVPDDAITDVAHRLVEHVPDTTLVAHVSGACGLDALDPLLCTASVHPLMSLPDGEVGAARLLDDCWFALDGDPRVRAVVDALGGRPFAVDPDRRVVYHAAASVAANHLTALCGQVETLARAAGVPAEAYWRLMATTLDNVTAVGAADALTGPAARGDWGTVRRHLDAMPASEREMYLVLAERAAELVGRDVPADLASD